MFNQIVFNGIIAGSIYLWVDEFMGEMSLWRDLC